MSFVVVFHLLGRIRIFGCSPWRSCNNIFFGVSTHVYLLTLLFGSISCFHTPATSCQVWRPTHSNADPWRWYWTRTYGPCQGAFQVWWRGLVWVLGDLDSLTDLDLHRFSCVPVDFEVVNVDSAATSEDDINNAITAIRRNGVALKGRVWLCRWTHLKIYALNYCRSCSYSCYSFFFQVI